jgi:uncharacterized protein YjdB
MINKLAVDGTLQLSPVWSSANDAIATVTESGLVTAVSPGTVEIYCTIEGIPFATIVSVVVPQPEQEPADV